MAIEDTISNEGEKLTSQDKKEIRLGLSSWVSSMQNEALFFFINGNSTDFESSYLQVIKTLDFLN